jgi:hypothetical protein
LSRPSENQEKRGDRPVKRYTVLLVLLVVVMVAVVVAVGIDGNSATANPSQTQPCGNCHTFSPTHSIAVSIFSQTGTEITYAVSGSTDRAGGEGWGAFNSSFTKVGGGTGPGTFTVPKDGTEYLVYWVDNEPGTTIGYAVAQFQTPLPTTTTTLDTTTTTGGVTTTTEGATTTTTEGVTTTTDPGNTTTTSAATTTTSPPASTTTTLPTGTLPVTG